jgi:hypothetical protein
LTDLTTGSAPIVKVLPTDPKANPNVAPYTYDYVVANANSTYTLSACLENDADNGANVIAAVGSCTTKTFQVINGN